MKKIFVILSAVILCLSFKLQAQSSGCGTQVSADQITFENGLSTNVPAKANASLPLLNLELSVTVYIIRDEDGLPGISSSIIQAAIDKVNNAFSPVKLKFRVCNTIYIDNYQFNSVNKLGNGKDLLIQNYTQNTINLYFASTAIDGLGSNVCGYTFMQSESKDKDAIIISKSCAGSNEIVHQFGHLFNLYHTHETVFGNELVKDPNGNSTGDRCFDTPADPNLSGVVSNCQYSGIAKDANKQFYIPYTTNFMSFSEDACRCNFTNDQYYRVIYSVQNLKNYLW